MNVFSDFSLRSLILTILVYGAFPMLFSYCRKNPITKKRVFVYCFLFNFVVMVILIIIAVALKVDQKVLPNGFPYMLWTTVFANTGIGVLTKHNLIVYPATKTSAQNAGEPKNLNRTTMSNSQETVNIPVYWVGGGNESNTSNDTNSLKQAKTLFCGNCGTRLPEGDIKFCPNCGIGLFPTRKAP